MKITRKAIAGINCYTCPICKGAEMRGVLFVRLGMLDYARMRVDGSVTKTVECNNERYPHMIEVVMERPKGSACILRGEQ
jgi:hypothetical protein